MLIWMRLLRVVIAARAKKFQSLFGISKLSSSECGNMEEVWELLTGLKSMYWKKKSQNLRSQVLCFNCAQLRYIYGGFDCSSKNDRLLRSKTGLQVPALGILLLRARLVFAQVHHYSIVELDAPEERRIIALKSCAGNEENTNDSAG